MSLRSKGVYKKDPTRPMGEGLQYCVLDWDELVLRTEKEQRCQFFLAERTGCQGVAPHGCHIPSDLAVGHAP